MTRLPEPTKSALLLRKLKGRLPLCILSCALLSLLFAYFYNAPSDDDILAATINRAKTEQWDKLPYNKLITEIALNFVGKPYVSNTVETAGPEQLVVNLREFDCVTFIESVLAIAALIHDKSVDAGNPEALRKRYQILLTQLRYRDGVIQGYNSRLHYFSDWLVNNEEKELVFLITDALGGVPLNSKIDYMSANSELYPKLQSSPERLQHIIKAEDKLNNQQRYFIPEDEVEGVSGRLQGGDIIAATTNITGLDVSHTGIAYRSRGEIKLIHAPEPGEKVRISRRTLSQRLLEIENQNGIMVARPQRQVSPTGVGLTRL